MGITNGKNICLLLMLLCSYAGILISTCRVTSAELSGFREPFSVIWLSVRLTDGCGERGGKYSLPSFLVVRVEGEDDGDGPSHTIYIIFGVFFYDLLSAPV